MLKINIEAVQDIIREVANKEILPRFRHLEKEDIDYKIGDDPVTIADKAAEKELSRRFLELLPGSKVLGEEAFFANHGLLDLFSDESPVWIIDPIDGTRNYVSGRPIFGVIVALTERNQTVAAWLYDPLSGEFITAEKGAGAFHKRRRLKVLEPDHLDKMLGAGIELEYAHNAALKRSDTALLSGPVLEPSLWSICHEYARLVTGSPSFSALGSQWHFHGLLSYCTPWDNAAGILIHGESGGYSAHWDGTAHRPNAFGRGVLLAPDQASWHNIRRWVSSFAEIPV
jgi:fructose-1,6-bisphosphatase/inositol monophosphatase family enzyme